MPTDGSDLTWIDYSIRHAFLILTYVLAAVLVAQAYRKGE
jgi:hypothetical protein